jgi:hypothetical protein
MLANNLYYLLYVVYRISFEKKPKVWVIAVDFIMDIFYLVDMLRILTTPYYNSSGKIETNKRAIFRRYAGSWLLFDLYAFFPLAYLRYISDYSAGGYDDFQNAKDLNYERLPRFYKL